MSTSTPTETVQTRDQFLQSLPAWYAGLDYTAKLAALLFLRLEFAQQEKEVFQLGIEDLLREALMQEEPPQELAAQHRLMLDLYMMIAV